MTVDLQSSEYTPQARLEFHSASESEGSTCALLTPAIKAKLREMTSGQVLEVRVDDPTAKEDILSWSVTAQPAYAWLSSTLFLLDDCVPPAISKLLR